MNRERNLTGSNGYEKDLGFIPIDFLRDRAEAHDKARWLDLCCGTGKALIQAAEICDSEELPIEIVGVDLVRMFLRSNSDRLQLIAVTTSSMVVPSATAGMRWRTSRRAIDALPSGK